MLSIVAFILLLKSSLNSSSYLRIFSFTLYGSTLFLVFITSTLFHSLRPFKVKALFLKLDHIAIYFLIAGTYTPLLLLVLGGRLGWIYFCILWFIVVLGTLFKLFNKASIVSKVSVFIYIIMGWILILFIKTIYKALSLQGFILLIMGGVFYTAGTLFFIPKKFYYSHSFWHICVLLGAFSHFICIYYYV